MGKRLKKIVLRRSGIHGRGVFALRRIRANSIVAEYTGERIDNDEVERRYPREAETGHTMLFETGDFTAIDATRRGGIARYINHSCAGNCRPVLDGDRVFIEARKNIQPGVELTYDYRLQRSGRRSKKVDDLYACQCGAARCRGTMLDPKYARRKSR